MSVEINSNIVSKNNFGPYLSLVTKPSDAFAAYKARVLADGGAIQDEAATLKAFEYLINNGLYGATKTWVSSKFGLKLDSDGSIYKAYSVDGADLVGKTFGTGNYPKLLEGEITFSNVRSDATNGGILTTELPLKLQGKGTALGIKMAKVLVSAAQQNMMASLTLHEDVNNASALLYLLQKGNGDQLAFMRQIDVANNNSSVAAKYVTALLVTITNSTYLFRTSEYLAICEGYRGGNLTTLPVANPANFDGFSAYIDFGGSYRKASNLKVTNFGNFSASHFFLFDEITDARAIKLAIMNI
ncbi:hypothetical protein L1Z56_05985 [Acinetobacter baumannii]|nr:hypothetical protein [Acinetobacter baumannii]MCF4586897.1 hypothetical protein [Acinetobacter baumannii]MCF4625668.1 hypothetical protein [Acinetobacter baumannii]